MTVIADKIFYCYSENNNVCDLIAQLDDQMLHDSIENEHPLTIIPIVKKEQPIIAHTDNSTISNEKIVPIQQTKTVFLLICLFYPMY